jgi:two-component system sensor histidine kinase KdpD
MRRFSLIFTCYLMLSLVVAGATLLMHLSRDFLDAPIIVLIYLLAVVIGTTIWGLGPGLWAAFTAFLAFNYFFIPPLYTLVVHRWQDVMALVIFLIIAVIINVLVGRAQAGMNEARSREQEAVSLYELSTALADARTESASAQLVAEHVRKVFQADQVEIAFQRPSQPETLFRTPGKSLSTGPADQIAPLATAHGLLGNLRVWRASEPFSITEQRLLNIFASQTALAIERAALTQAETRAKVLEESDQLKSALLSSVSHELRTPLATIRAAATSLRSGEVDWDSPARPNLLTSIDEEARHLNRLVGNLLDMSRIEAGAMEPNCQWNDLNEIVASVLTRLQFVAQSHDIQIDFPDDLPLVPVDYVQIEQVFNNLLSNSLKYAKQGTQIVINARVESESVHVQVTNQGPPVPEEHLSRIFDKFYRVTAADRVTGTGLGLSICKGIIEAHGGRIWAENLPDRFAFNFTLPLERAGMPPLSSTILPDTV